MSTANKPGFTFVLDVQLPVQLMQRLVREFQGSTTTLSLAGDLTNLPEGKLANCMVRDWPQSGGNLIAYIPLTGENVAALATSILPGVGIHTRVYEVNIKRDGEELFAAYDGFSAIWWFDQKAVGPYTKGAGVSGISTEVLDELVADGIIRRYLPAGHKDLVQPIRITSIRVKRRAGMSRIERPDAH